MTKFYINDDNLMFERDNVKEAYKLPHSSSELENTKAFIDNLNYRASKMDLTAETIKVNSNYVFLFRDESLLNPIKVKFPSTKSSYLKVRNETHTIAKVGALKARMTIQDYVHLCLVQCKSDKK